MEGGSEGGRWRVGEMSECGSKVDTHVMKTFLSRLFSSLGLRKLGPNFIEAFSVNVIPGRP